MLMRNIFIIALTYWLASSLTIAQPILNFDDFSNISSLQLNGSATPTTTTDGSILRLTPAASAKQVGSAFTQSPVNIAHFSTFFTFRLTESGDTEGNIGGENQVYDGSLGGEGFVFVVQSERSDWLDLRDYWDNDLQLYEPSGLGYHYLPYSVGVEFDTWGNWWKGDPNSNHVGMVMERSNQHEILSTEFGIVAPQPSTPDFNDGNLWYAWIDYDGTTLEVRTSQTCYRPSAPLISQALDISALLGGKEIGEEWIERINEGFVGFTATTSPTGFNNHDIINWIYRDTFEPIELPQLEVWDEATQITSGSTVDLGSTTVGNPLSKTFTLKNTGDMPIPINSLTVPTDFNLVGDFPSSIPPRGTVPLTVQLTAPVSPGSYTGTLQFSYQDCNDKEFNFVITSNAVNNSPITDLEQQKTCFEQNSLFNHEQCIWAETSPAMMSSGASTDAEIRAGISLYENDLPTDFQRSNAITLNDPIITAGVIKVDNRDIGKKASIIVAGIYISSVYPTGFMWYMLNDCPDCPLGWTVTALPYNEVTALPLLTQPDLLPLKTVDNLPEYYTVELYAGNLPMPGFLNIFFGYRIEAGDDQGKVVFNRAPISITINRPLT